MALWCDERLLVDLIGPQGVVSEPLAQPFARVGSHPESEVVLADGPLGGRSLYLHAIPGGLFCVDLRRVQSDSANLGFWLKPTDEVGIGRYWLRARLQGPVPRETQKARLDQDESATYPRPVLSILSGKHCVAKKRLQSSLNTVGRWPQCGLQLQGQLVSGVHCALYWHAGRLWCIDLLSSNRTLHREQPITCVELTMGDRVEVGEFDIVFERLSRQKEVAEPKSRPYQAGVAVNDSDRQGNSPRSRRKAWREPELGIADSSGTALPAAISPRSNSEPNELITASDSAITVDQTTAVIIATMQGTASDIGKDGVPSTNQLPELQQLAELSRRLHGQVAQIKSEANHLADLTDRLNLASLQWAENRAEILGLLTSSLSPPALAGIARPLEPAGESSAPKLIAPATATDSSTAVSNDCSNSTPIALGTTSSLSSIPENPSEGGPPRLLSPVPAQVPEVTSVVETAKAPDPNASRPLPSGRATRGTSIKRNELVDFVSDRIAILERQRRRKKLFIGLGVAVAILLLLGMIGGAWYSLA